MFVNKPKTKEDWMWLVIMVSLSVAILATGTAYANSLELAKRDYNVNTEIPNMAMEIGQLRQEVNDFRTEIRNDMNDFKENDFAPVKTDIGLIKCAITQCFEISNNGGD